MLIYIFVFLNLTRFFGRLANENAIHDEETLKAIRENTDGLRGIEHEVEI